MNCIIIAMLFISQWAQYIQTKNNSPLFMILIIDFLNIFILIFVEDHFHDFHPESGPRTVGGRDWVTEIQTMFMLISTSASCIYRALLSIHLCLIWGTIYRRLNMSKQHRFHCSCWLSIMWIGGLCASTCHTSEVEEKLYANLQMTSSNGKWQTHAFELYRQKQRICPI